VAETAFVIDFQILETTSLNPPIGGIRDVRTFCTCGWEEVYNDRLGAWAMGEIHWGHHLRRGEPATLMMADGPKTYHSKAERDSAREAE
jgi:hypothetical protein